MTAKATLDDFEGETSSGESGSLTLEERLLTPISPSIGLRVIAGRGDPLYLQNRGTERYLFRDDHDRWFILQPSAKDSEEAFVRWVYLPADRPERLAQSALRRRTVIGYDYVQWSAAPDPVRSTVTAMARHRLRVWVVRDAVRHVTRACPPLLGRPSVGAES